MEHINKELKEEIVDLKATVFINKELVKELSCEKITDVQIVKILRDKDKQLDLLTSSIENLRNLIDKQSTEKANLLNQIEQLISSKEADLFENKIFLLENQLKMKENENIGLRKQNELVKRKHYFEMERIVCDPTFAICDIKNELESLKKSHEMVEKLIEKHKLTVNKYVRIVEVK